MRSVIQHLPDLVHLLWGQGCKCQAGSTQPVWKMVYLNFPSFNHIDTRLPRCQAPHGVRSLASVSSGEGKGV